MNGITTPCILKETSEGSIRHTIQDEMFQRREVSCTGSITMELADSLILQLRYLQAEDPGKEITMYVNSPGGDVSSGLALYDVMQAVTCPVRTICVGMAASMAALLFTSGDKRDIFPHARVMIHDPILQGGTNGNALSVYSMSQDLMKVRKVNGEIIARHTHKTLDEILEKTARDSFFDAEEAVAFGLADRIIRHINTGNGGDDSDTDSRR